MYFIMRKNNGKFTTFYHFKTSVENYLRLTADKSYIYFYPSQLIAANIRKKNRVVKCGRILPMLIRKSFSQQNTTPID